jgi:hypothetical protein
MNEETQNTKPSNLNSTKEWLIIFSTVLTGIGILINSYTTYLNSQSIKISNEALKLTASNVVYSLNQEPSKFYLQYPELYKYFYRETRGNLSDDDLIKEYDSLPPEKKARVIVICEALADAIEMTYVQRENLLPDDWDGWWNYDCDLYDRSPIIRNWLERNGKWYEIDDALKNPDRTQYYRGKLNQLKK